MKFKMSYSTYLLLWELQNGETIKIGKLGKSYFPPGFYFYAGKALRGIEARIARHIYPRKKRRWHIDYFSTRAVPVGMKLYSEKKYGECELAQKIQLQGGEIILNGFGSSDCRCPSHFYYFKNYPNWP